MLIISEQGHVSILALLSQVIDFSFCNEETYLMVMPGDEIIMMTNVFGQISNHQGSPVSQVVFSQISSWMLYLLQ